MKVDERHTHTHIETSYHHIMILILISYVHNIYIYNIDIAFVFLFIIHVAGLWECSPLMITKVVEIRQEKIWLPFAINPHRIPLIYPMISTKWELMAYN